MLLAVRRSLMLVGCVSVGFVISAGPGLVARAAEPDRWVEAIAANVAAAAPDDAVQRRVSELEQRVKELEAERRALEAATKSSELKAAMARNQELEQQNLALSLENQELVQRRALEASAPAVTPRPPTQADARAQLRYWARQIRDGENSARWLSPEWNAAVNVLVRSERQLDPQNPWREP